MQSLMGFMPRTWRAETDAECLMRVLLGIVFLFSVAIVIFAVIGGYLNYSPVPFWDMWNGTLEFIYKVDSGDYTAWLAQHNDHRIFLARLLFWVDEKIFGGVGVFLIVSNYIIASLAAILYWRIIVRVGGDGVSERGSKILALISTACIFLWTQESNFTWGFQSQFLLVQLLPLCALYFLSLSVESKSPVDFFKACFFGVLSVGTMVNGIFILPLMVLYSCFFKQGFLRIVCLLFLSFASIFLYFFRYHYAQDDGGILNSIINHPFDFIIYTAMYMGNVFYYLFGLGDVGKWAAVIAGILFAAISMVMFIMQLVRQERSPLVFALIFFIVYITSSALATAGGRLFLGVDQALSSRYTTPTIMAWVALIIVIWSQKYKLLGVFFVAPLAVVIGYLMFSYQLSALRSMAGVYSVRDVAALAVTLDVMDSKYISNIYPNIDYVALFGPRYVNEKYSVFGRYPYVNLSNKIGSSYDVSQIKSHCVGALDVVEPIDNVHKFVRVQGWLFDSNSKLSPKLIRFLDKNNRIVGFGLTGALRSDVEKAVGSSAKLSGYVGYVQTSATLEPLFAVGDVPNCISIFNWAP